MGLLAKLLSHISGSDAPPPGPPAEARWNARAVAEVLQHFPIGSRVLYCPEFKKELRLESIILACGINQFLAYSQSDVTLSHNGGEERLFVRSEGPGAAVDRISSFHLVIPHQTRSEVDYRPPERKELAPQMVQNTINDFTRGSYITLISFSPYGRAPRLEARVKATSTLTKGHYANHKVVILEPEPHSLSYVDKRKHQRVATRIEARIRLQPDGEEAPCLLEDFSERFLRVRLNGEGLSPESLPVGRRLYLAIDLPHAERSLTLQAAVFRQGRGRAVVVEVKAIQRDGRFVGLQLIDQLDLKASLLQHPETQQLLRAGGG